MTEIPDNVDLRWIARHLVDFRDETRAAIADLRRDMATIRRDLDMLTRIVLRLDSTVDALREDVKTLWLSQGDLRSRVEALEAREGR